jgi:hypothetical protein
MKAPSDGPIHSLLGDDQSLERLDPFVLSLGERIDAIQDAECRGQLEEAAKCALELAAEAVELAIPPLAAAAERAAVSCRRDDPARAREAIVALTDVVRRVRLGHRSAV